MKACPFKKFYCRLNWETETLLLLPLCIVVGTFDTAIGSTNFVAIVLYGGAVTNVLGRGRGSAPVLDWTYQNLFYQPLDLKYSNSRTRIGLNGSRPKWSHKVFRQSAEYPIVSGNFTIGP